MLILGRIAATDVSTNETQAKVDPCIADLHTVLTHMFVRFSHFDLIKVGTFLRHRFLLDVLVNVLFRNEQTLC
ncbi:MAG: hypothetical protein ACLPND_13135, partial [Candidatus Korobacteraceae bacterium]